MRIWMIAAGFAMLTACESTLEPPQRTARQQADYDRQLAGKVAGTAERCLPTYRSNDMTIIDDNTILFRDGRTVYVNTPIGACHGLSGMGRMLVIRNFGPQLCRGDIATVADNTSGMTVGSCTLGDFVPYRQPQG